MREKRVMKVVAYVTLAILLIFSLFPIYWILNTSLKNDREIYRVIPTFWPDRPTMNGYRRLFTDTGFTTYFTNSLVVSTVVTLASVFVGMLAAYAIARLNFWGKRGVSRSILYAYLMSNTVMYIPLYLLVATVGLANSRNGLILIYPTFVIPYATWMLSSYFKSVPKEIEESAIIDGCSRIGSMFRMVFPLSMPGIVATAIFSFTRCWSEYLYALVSITKDAQKTLPLGLSQLIMDDLFNWGPLMGGAILSTIPIIVLYTFSSKFMVTGLTTGGVKG